ncbi:hypothetical protein EYF80_019994 [Liparis tanakae]|uniref:Uncharacterized protein n=1 Tax=Liparis tanakae TaxID=230148 RepID=A0A4Z2HXV2_9TELE|nr:hypothetical protein EYF80_019994 [Liparis tanakae]
MWAEKRLTPHSSLLTPRPAIVAPLFISRRSPASPELFLVVSGEGDLDLRPSPSTSSSSASGLPAVHCGRHKHSAGSELSSTSRRVFLGSATKKAAV